MALTLGARLGPYEITGTLGVGGMGEVYRATDTNLKRAVAIKVLPESVATDRDRLARFQREAEVLASLNHPNIAAIYGLERSNGTTALVMELVEGPTLADRIAQGPIPVDEALPIAKQIAEALEAAHERGIIHRDLKPANIKVRPDGTVKVLDFGLAKALEPAVVALDATQSPTIISPAMMTSVGMLLGTAAYMSPEQARGKSVDKRSDSWAFGCVLYEMLTGRRAFEGHQVTDVLAAVIRADLQWDALPSTLHPGIRRVLERCLDKDVRNRWHDIADVRLEIDAILRDPIGPRPAESEGIGATSYPWRFAVAAFATGAVLTSLVAWSLRSVPAIEAEPVRFSYEIPAVGQHSTPIVGKIAISSDGRHVAYLAGGQLYVRALDAFEGVPLTGAQAGGNPFFSPDGRWIGFHADGKLQRVSLAGGAPLTITRAAAVFGASWGPDDTIVFGGGVGSGLLRVPASGGTPEPLTVPDTSQGEVNHGLPHILPDGRSIVFTVGTGQGSRLALFSLDSGASRDLLPVGAGAQYLANGYLLFSETGNLRLVAFDAAAGTVTGPVIPALDGILWENQAGLETAWFAVSRGGDLVYVPGGRQELTTTPVWVDRSGREASIDVAPALYVGPRIAPNGRHVGFSRIGRNGLGEMWVLDVESGRMFPVATQGANYNATWRRDIDGKLTFTSNGDLFETSVATQDAPTRLLQRDDYQYPLSWSPDGRFLAFMDITPRGTHLWMLPREGKPARVLDSASNAGAARFSPDGEWLAYVSDETGQQEVYVRHYAGTERGQQVSRNGGREPAWSADGKTLFYRSGDSMMAVDIVTSAVFRSAPPVELWRRPYFSLDMFGVHNYDVAGDGRFLMLRPPDDTTAVSTRLNVVLHWLGDARHSIAGIGASER